MKKITEIILPKNSIYKGIIEMPDGWNIKKDIIVKHITLNNYYTDYKNSFCRELDRVETYILDYLRAEQKVKLETEMANCGYYFEKNERSKPFIEHNVCDYICLYGVETDPNTCKVIVNLNNNVYDFLIETNTFIIIPAESMYYIENTNNSYLNYINKFFFVRP